MTKVCSTHIVKPAFIYGQCIGCELEMYQTRIKELEEEVKSLKGRQALETTESTQA